MARLKDACMFCGEVPCICNAKPKAVKRGAHKKTVKSPIEAPTKPPRRPANKSLSVDDIMEVYALQALDHAGLLGEEAKVKYESLLNHKLTPEQEAIRWREWRKLVNT